ncbi:nucleoside 2-deoxyribosyltransferase [Bradyrhizobium japonicum]
MPFPATVFNVLIASPSDVPHERAAIAECLYAWNALHSKDTGKVLLPMMWESHSAPSMSDRPQEVINEQLVRKCDMLIGAFWTRLGSPTGKAKSGTVEEINWCMKQKKPVMLYFSKQRVDLDNLDTSQFEELKQFRESLKQRGLLEQYESIAELTEKLSRQITIITREMSVTSTVDAQAMKKAIKASDDTIALERTEQPKDGIFMEEYSEKSFILVGDTVALKEQIKEIGASWTRTRHGFSAWCFSKKKISKVAELLNAPTTLAPAWDA